jgi:hypothetical protein
MKKMLLFVIPMIFGAAGTLFGQVPQPRPFDPVAPALPACGCPNAVSLPNQRGCFVSKCEVPGLRDGPVGGGYVAFKNVLYQPTTCCAPIQNQNLSTGTAAWRLVSTPTQANLNIPVTPLTFWGLPAGGTAKFVGPASGAQGGPAGKYVYELTFCLCQAPIRPVLNLKVLADNGATIWVGGNQMGNPMGNPVGATTAFPYGHAAANAANVTLTSPHLVPGVNKIRIEVNNQDGPTGLYVEATLNAVAGLCRQGAVGETLGQ